MVGSSRRVRLASSALILLVGLLGAVGPASAQVTSLSMTSEPGDYIGGGQTYFYGAGEGNFGAQVNYAGGVTISFVSGNYDHWWNLSFRAPGGAPLTTGTYLNALRFPFQGDTAPGLDVSGDGRGCNGLTGSFQVLQIEYGPDNTVTAFNATFEQHCEGMEPALRGEIRFNAQVPLYLTVPFNVVALLNQNTSFLVTATDEQSRSVALSASGLPQGATFTDHGNSTGTFSWTPSNNQSGTYYVAFAGDNGQGNQATASAKIVARPPPPDNDEIESARMISGIPTTFTQDATYATSAPNDPWCNGNAQTVWYQYTPQVNERVEVNTFGSGYDTTLGVYVGAPGSLSWVACNDDANGTKQSRARFDAVAGKTYYIMVSSLYYPVPEASLVLSVQPAPPPFSFNPSIAQFGSVVSTTGAITISGTVDCSEEAYATLYGHVKQLRGGVPVSAYWNTSFVCNGVTPWQTTIRPMPELFNGRAALLFGAGRINVGATAQAFQFDTGEYRQANLATIVTLRGKK